MSEYTRFNGDRLNERQVNELIGIARGLVADDHLNDLEIEYLHKWLAANESVTNNPIIATLITRLEEVFVDGVIDDDERADLTQTLVELTGSDFEVGEALKSTTLPLCSPAPQIDFKDRRFTFTGTFVFGKRRDCEAITVELGGVAGSLRLDTNFLVIGEYAADDWIQSSYGRKIEKAVKYRDSPKTSIHIVSEAHWRQFL